MAEHTPGPWSVVGATKVWKTGADGAAVAIAAEPEIESSSDIRPVELYSGRFDEACANARLIAAAPDLLIALRGCASELGRNLQRETDPLQRAWLKTARDAALVAIAKASESRIEEGANQ